MSKKSWAAQPRKPIILHAEDTWQKNEKYIAIEDLEAFDSEAGCETYLKYDARPAKAPTT